MPCSICGEVHGPDRTLSYDGKGVNSCDKYRGRLATLTYLYDDDVMNSLGRMFAAAPEMLETLERIQGAFDSGIDAKSRYAHEVRATIRKAKGE